MLCLNNLPPIQLGESKNIHSVEIVLLPWFVDYRLTAISLFFLITMSACFFGLT